MYLHTLFDRFCTNVPLLVMALLLILMPACGRQNIQKKKEIREHTSATYIQKVHAAYAPFIALLKPGFGIGWLFSSQRDAQLLALVRTQIQSDREQISWIQNLLGKDKKAHKRFSLIFCAKKIKRTLKKLTKIVSKIDQGVLVHLNKIDIIGLQDNLIAVRDMVKAHPRYERERDLYELHQAVNGGVVKYLKPAISIATKIV